MSQTLPMSKHKFCSAFIAFLSFVYRHFVPCLEEGISAQNSHGLLYPIIGTFFSPLLFVCIDMGIVTFYISTVLFYSNHAANSHVIQLRQMNLTSVILKLLYI